MTRIVFWILVALNIIWLAVWQLGGFERGVAKPVPKQINAESVVVLPPDVDLPSPPPALPVPEVVTTPEAPLIVDETNAEPNVVAEAPVDRVDVEPKPEPAPVPEPIPEPVAKPEEKMSCMEWGDFSKQNVAEPLKALARYQLDKNVTQQQTKSGGTYWVFIPPASSQDKLQENILQLKELGVKEYFVVHDKPEAKNAISLGVFKTEAAAKRQLELLKARKVSGVKMAERDFDTKILLRINKLSEQNVKQVIDAKKSFAKTQLKRMSCQ